MAMGSAIGKDAFEAIVQALVSFGIAFAEKKKLKKKKEKDKAQTKEEEKKGTEHIKGHKSGLESRALSAQISKAGTTQMSAIVDAIQSLVNDFSEKVRAAASALMKAFTKLANEKRKKEALKASGTLGPKGINEAFKEDQSEGDIVEKLKKESGINEPEIKTIKDLIKHKLDERGNLSEEGTAEENRTGLEGRVAEGLGGAFWKCS